MGWLSSVVGSLGCKPSAAALQVQFLPDPLHSEALGDRLMVGHLTLTQAAKVQVLLSQPMEGSLSRGSSGLENRQV